MILDSLEDLQHLHLVLASASPRRAELLRMLDVPFEVKPSTFAEDLVASRFESAGEYAQETAFHKAVEVASRMFSPGNGPDIVLSADTVVESPDGLVLEKPKDEAEAKEMLKALSNRRHRVHTGVAIVAPGLLDPEKGRSPFVRTFVETTVCYMGKLSDELIEAYVATGDPMDKAGAYGIQGKAGAFVNRIEGCYFNVVGFPLHRITLELRGILNETELGSQLKGRKQLR